MMRLHIDCPYEFHMELRAANGSDGLGLHHERIACDIPTLVEETFVGGVLGERFPAEPEEVRCSIQPVWSVEPRISGVKIDLSTTVDGARVDCSQTFKSGRWSRRALIVLEKLRAEQTVAADKKVYLLLSAIKDGRPSSIQPPPIQAPAICDQTLEDFGIRGLGPGDLTPNRPVLVSKRAVEDSLELCTGAGIREAGAVMLGKIIRLPEPLEDTHTRVVTVLSAVIGDRRHVGALGQVTFHPEALVEAEKVVEMRARGEIVFTVVHSHGWCGGCETCNEQKDCPLPECTQVSENDYILAESMFPSKATLLPIVGRKLGAEGRRPVLEVHAWRGGAMRSLRWRQYFE